MVNTFMPIKKYFYFISNTDAFLKERGKNNK